MLNDKELNIIATNLYHANSVGEVVNIIEQEKISKDLMLKLLSEFNIFGIYYNLPKDYQNDKRLFMKCLSSNPEIVNEKINEMTEKDLLEAININNKVYYFLPISYKEDKVLSLKYLETKGANWEYVPLSLRKEFLQNSTIVDKLLNFVNIFKYLSDEFKREPSFIKKAFDLNKDNISLVKDKSIKKELIMSYLDKNIYVNGNLMNVIVADFNSDMEVISEAIKINSGLYSMLDSKKQEDMKYIRCLLHNHKKEFYHDRVNVDLIKHKTLKNNFNEIISVLSENYPDMLVDMSVYQIALEKKIIAEDYNETLNYEKLNTLVNKLELKKDIEIDVRENKKKVKVRKF